MLAQWSRRFKSPVTQNNGATLRRGDRGIRVDRLGFFSPLKILSFWKRPG
jgi:hypothetical protein